MPIFFSEFSLRNAQDASPNWSECTCGRNTYWSFLSFSTAEATQTFIQKNFFAASVRCAIGTQCALEKTPISTSTRLLVDETLGLVDGDVGLRLRIGVDRADPVALDPALFVDHVDRDLVAEVGCFRPAGRERSGEVVEDPDLDLFLSHGGCGEHGRKDCAGAEAGTRERPEHEPLLECHGQDLVLLLTGSLSGRPQPVKAGPVNRETQRSRQQACRVSSRAGRSVGTTACARARASRGSDPPAGSRSRAGRGSRGRTRRRR